MPDHRLALTVSLFVVCTSPFVHAETITVGVGFDRWNYPFNTTPGSRASGSLFGSLGSPSFDNRDAQVIFGFDVSSVTSPLPDQELTSVTLRVTTAGVDAFLYDPTLDPLDSYTTATDPDEGRPLELFGVGTRNGFTALTVDGSSANPLLYKESTPYSPTPGLFLSSRSAFAADVAGEDISNNITANEEITPWAIGQAVNLTPGSSVPMNTEFEFAIDLTDGGIANYVEEGLDAGDFFCIDLTSLSLTKCSRDLSEFLSRRRRYKPGTNSYA